MLNKNFENNRRRKQELKGRPIADEIYKKVFGQEILIERFEREENYQLDLIFAMDVKIVMPIGLILVGQEKFLSYENKKYQSITVEYMQNPVIGERGDWFKLAVQFYFTAYFNEPETCFDLWVLTNWMNVVLCTMDNKIMWKSGANTRTNARANFKYCNMYQLPAHCIIASSWSNKIHGDVLRLALFDECMENRYKEDLSHG